MAIAVLVQSPLHAFIGNLQPWVLQLGYFAELDNALAFKQGLEDVGFEALAVATGGAGEQRFRVISGASAEPAGLFELRDAIEAATGKRGIVTENPLRQAANLFDQPTLSHYLAQAGAPDSSARLDSYDPMLDRAPQDEVEPAPGFTSGGLQIIPTLGLSIGHDNNITLASDNEISSTFYMISPAVRVEMPSDNSVFSITGAADITRYQDSPLDDSTYWYLRGAWAWDVSTRQDINLFGQYSEGSDRRGEGRRQGDQGLVPLDPDEWQRWDIGGEWDYGAVGARGRLVLEGGASDLTYTNNRGAVDGFPGTRRLDRDWLFWGGTFYWRVAPKSSLLLDYRYTDFNYKLSDDANSVEHSGMAGVTWDATARTTGTVKYGYLKKDFDDPARSDYDGPTWALSIDWRPRTYSTFTLAGSMQTQEPEGNGDYILRRDITLSWVHAWATRFGTSVDVGFGRDEYRPLERTDDLFYWGAGANYTFNTHFRFAASVTSYNRDSIEPQYDYDHLVYMLSLEATY